MYKRQADVCTKGESLASCITSLYNERGEEGANGLYYHDGVGTYTTVSYTHLMLLLSGALLIALLVAIYFSEKLNKIVRCV